MKNFKRVLSAVVALAISASTLVAVSASKFTDVDDTNSYVEAIDVLSSLGIINGFEDGTFKPDGEITRAQAATMIVGALNMTNDAKAAEGTTKFDDMNNDAKKWATGYVNVGVAQGFIAGMDDKTFAPDKNVTYAQMCVMLTKITGYGEYAASYGGYPTGYTTMAASAGINKGVAVATDANLKRGQVAQMIYNALTAPLLGVKAYNLNGNDYAIQDGTDLAFKTLLADKFEGYEADVTVTDVPKSDDALNKGEVKISLDKATFLDQTKVKTGTVSNPFAGFGTVIDEAGVEDKLFVSGKAIVRKDSNDKWHLVYFSSSELDKVVVNASEYVTVAKGGKNADATDAAVPGDGKVTFGSKTYRVNTNATTTDAAAAACSNGTIYVNGLRYGDITQANIATILPLAQGEITLIDNDKTDRANANYADGYDIIMTTVYDVARVDAVIASAGTTTLQVTPLAGAALHGTVTGIEFNDDAVADGEVDLTVKNAAGEDVALASIKRGDIIAYAVPYSAGLTANIEPTVIDIRVTDEKISGTVTREDPTEETYTIGDTAYEMSAWSGTGTFKVGTGYTFKLDPFGRIYDYDEVEATAYKYAIANNVENGELQLILADGTAKYYELSITSNNIKDNANITGVATAIGTTGNLGVTIGQLEAYIEGTAAGNKALAVNRGTDRVVKYTVKNSTGKIDSLELLTPNMLYPVGGEAEFRESTSKLGNYTIASTSSVIDAQSVNALGTSATADYKKFSNANFKDKEKYAVAIFNDQANYGNTALFAVITVAGKDINDGSRFVVVKKEAAQTQTSAGDNCMSLTVLHGGEEKAILCTLDSGVGSLQAGDAIFYKTDSDGLVNSYHKVYDAATATATLSFGSYTYEAADWNFTVNNAANVDYQFVYGIVTNVTSRGVEFYTKANAAVDNGAVPGTTNNGDYLDLSQSGNSKVFGIKSDCLNYRFASKEAATAPALAYKYVNVGAPTASPISAYETGKNTSVFDLDNASDGNGSSKLTYALAIIVNGDIAEIYTITQ